MKLKIILSAFISSVVLLIAGCSSETLISEEAFCDLAVEKIVKYKEEKGLTVIRTKSGSLFLSNTRGFTIFKGMKDEIAQMKKSDPVKYYNLDSDSDVMYLCKIEVK